MGIDLMKKFIAIGALLFAGMVRAEPILLACDWLTPEPSKPTMRYWTIDLDQRLIHENKWGFEFNITAVTDEKIIGEAGDAQNWFRVEFDRHTMRLKDKYPGSITTFQCQLATERLT
jgi:hypothetical protein